jgi:hypothetical protein
VTEAERKAIGATRTVHTQARRAGYEAAQNALTSRAISKIE